jgi:hypothetical protein
MFYTLLEKAGSSLPDFIDRTNRIMRLIQGIIKRK